MHRDLVEGSDTEKEETKNVEEVSMEEESQGGDEVKMVVFTRR